MRKNCLSFFLFLSEKSKRYVHRIGRTARAGAKGNAISFVCSDGEEAVLAEAAALQNEEVRPFSFKLSAVEGERGKSERFSLLFC